MKARLVYWLLLGAIAALLSRIGMDGLEIRALRAELASAASAGAILGRAEGGGPGR